MAETAETMQKTQVNQENFELQTLGLVEAVPEMEHDARIRFRAARFIGACMVNEQVVAPVNEANLAVQPIESLYDAIHLAADGSESAYNMVETNVRTDVIERTIKTGHVIKIDLHVDEAGRIQQHGQSMESVQANSLRFAANSQPMRERVEAEAVNAFRIEEYYKAGTLEDYSFVVFSRAADNMSLEEMDETGFFTDTMSCAIQVTTADGNRLTTESAFVAGVRGRGEGRHDAETVVSVARRLGVNLEGKTAAEIIDTPLLIHNSLLENGVVDIVKLYDDCAGGTFFGEARPRQDYPEYREKCLERELMLHPKVDAIMKELIDEAPKIHDRITAVQRLHKISEKHMVEQAVFDDTIDPRVFGVVAAIHIEQARIQFEAGNYNTGLNLIADAKKTATSSSCPTALKKSIFDGAEDSSEEKPEDESGDCDFISKKCPVCGEKNVKTHVTKTKITGSCGCEVRK